MSKTINGHSQPKIAIVAGYTRGLSLNACDFTSTCNLYHRVGSKGCVFCRTLYKYCFIVIAFLSSHERASERAA